MPCIYHLWWFITLPLFLFNLAIRDACDDDSDDYDNLDDYDDQEQGSFWCWYWFNDDDVGNVDQGDDVGDLDGVGDDVDDVDQGDDVGDLDGVGDDVDDVDGGDDFGRCSPGGSADQDSLREPTLHRSWGPPAGINTPRHIIIIMEIINI